MKETKLIKFNILLLILALCIIFSVSLTRDYLIKAAKPASAEEPGIPLETYLNGNYKSVTPQVNFKNHKNITLKPSKHPQRKVKISDHVYFGGAQAQKFKKGNLDIYKYQTAKDILGELFYKIIGIEVQSTVGMWNGIDVKYSLSFYKNGKNEYTKNIQGGRPVGNSYQWVYGEYVQNIRANVPGTYVLHIHHIIHTVAHWDAEERITYLKDHVFAFQIGDGDDVG